MLLLKREEIHSASRIKYTKLRRQFSPMKDALMREEEALRRQKLTLKRQHLVNLCERKTFN